MVVSSQSSRKLNLSPGSIVTCRDRRWVVLPSDNRELIRLRPLSGSEDRICGLYRPLIGKLESIESAEFPLPKTEVCQDSTAAHLLMNAARLSLRSGAGPFRSLGRLSLRPRPYQLVPLLMALRLETVRLLVADDVGIGKTIEAGLIAREMLDRGETSRIAVLCPPHLCDQWQRELNEKFHIDAVVIRSGTISKLERNLPSSDTSVFSYYPHIIVSLDYAKSERRRENFLAHCPDFVIVDEAHTCTERGEGSRSIQQRHQLVRKLSEKNERHLVLLTATPHSGIETAFQSLLGLLDSDFERLELDNLSKQDRSRLARHFVQRRRADIKSWMGSETPFPERQSLELTYQLSSSYRELSDSVYDFARGLIRTAEREHTHAKRQGRYWSALAIMRCIMSSPAAAISTLSHQANKDADAEEAIEDLNEIAAAYTYDPTEQEGTTDAQPASIVSSAQQTYSKAERRKLQEFLRATQRIVENQQDTKLQAARNTIADYLLSQGYNPIVWCRYIATTKYVAEDFKRYLGSRQVEVKGITGELSEEERELQFDELTQSPQRVLVATDCLSEGINLQAYFDAVLQYDLPWNPNRLEQREGRIDRYGQTTPKVPCYMLYGQDNPVDGAVLEVLVRKAIHIHKILGVSVPVPKDSNQVSEAVIHSLFSRSREGRQLTLDDWLQSSQIAQVHECWDQAVKRERRNRTRFAQRTIDAAEVQQELEESDRVLGSEDVANFVRMACERLNATLSFQENNCWHLPHVPDCVKPVLGDRPRKIAFSAPAPEGVEYVGRNHLLVEGLANHLLEDALENEHDPVAARCGLTVTDAVSRPTSVFLLRLRYLLGSSKQQPMLAEECLLRGFLRSPSNPEWMDPDELQSLLTASPVADMPFERKRRQLQKLIERLSELEPSFRELANDRARALQESHERVRAIARASKRKVQVEPQLPPDIIGVYILQPCSQ